MKQFSVKTLTLTTILFACLAAGQPMARAAVFSDVVTFNPNLVSYGSSQSSGFSWLHDITDNIAGHSISDINILDASLTISHDDTGASELWTLTGLGNLNSSNNPLTTAFTFNASQIADLQADGFFSIFLTESTAGADSLLLFTSTLTGNYDVKPTPPTPSTNVPEPFTAALVLSGLGIGAVSRRFRK